MADEIWRMLVGDGPLVATAIHDGHAVRDEIAPHFLLNEVERLREEDPFTALWTDLAPTRVVGLRSRFEVDLNRPREKAVYRQAEDAWGLQVWRNQPSEAAVARSLAEYDAFYAALHDLYGTLVRQHGAIVVYDLHSYNHRRGGPTGEAADSAGNPQVNVGTGTMQRRDKFAGVVARFKHDLGAYDFPGGRLDVRENVKFIGGNHPRWTHELFPDAACVLAIEVKKFFMDEWTGRPDGDLVRAIGKALAATVPGVLEELARVACQA